MGTNMKPWLAIALRPGHGDLFSPSFGGAYECGALRGMLLVEEGIVNEREQGRST